MRPDPVDSELLITPMWSKHDCFKSRPYLCKSWESKPYPRSGKGFWTTAGSSIRPYECPTLRGVGWGRHCWGGLSCLCLDSNKKKVIYPWIQDAQVGTSANHIFQHEEAVSFLGQAESGPWTASKLHLYIATELNVGSSMSGHPSTLSWSSSTTSSSSSSSISSARRMACSASRSKHIVIPDLWNCRVWHRQVWFCMHEWNFSLMFNMYWHISYRYDIAYILQIFTYKMPVYCIYI